MKFPVIARHRGQYPLELMCRGLGVSISGYYSWVLRGSSKREREEDRLVGLIREIHQRSRRTYGSPRIHPALKVRGEACSQSRVERLMRKHGVRAKTKKKFKATTDSKHKLPVAENILDRKFNPETSNQAWGSDITYIWTREGWLYLAVVMDLYSRKIVGWAMESRMTRKLVLKAFKMALRQRNPKPGLLSHSDRGSQYASGDFQKLLKFFGFRCSMSRKGNCWDNAVVESFFGTLKQEHVFFCDFQTREEARQSIFEWIEVFYNRERTHSSLGFRSPVDYEKTITAA